MTHYKAPKKALLSILVHPIFIWNTFTKFSYSKMGFHLLPIIIYKNYCIINIYKISISTTLFLQIITLKGKENIQISKVIYHRLSYKIRYYCIQTKCFIEITNLIYIISIKHALSHKCQYIAII